MIIVYKKEKRKKWNVAIGVVGLKSWTIVNIFANPVVTVDKLSLPDLFQ